MDASKLFCKVIGWWRTLSFWAHGGKGATVSGHVFKSKELHENCSVLISYCKDCDTQSISWVHGKFSDDHMGMMYETGACSCIKSKLK